MTNLDNTYNTFNQHTNDLMYQNKTNYKNDTYYKLINIIYQLIYDKELFELDDNFPKYLKDDYSIEIKDCIVQYLNPENYTCQYFVNYDTKRSAIMDKEILKALDVLEHYKTPEYKHLLDNGFYDYKLDIEPIDKEYCDNSMDDLEGEPLKERVKYEPYRYKKWLLDYRNNFIKELESLNIKKYLGERIAKNLEKIASL